MISGDEPDRDWPFLDGEWPSERSGHVRLKNLAAFFLISQGINPDDIVEERPYNGTYIDVSAELDDGTIVGVECETTEREDKHMKRNKPNRQGHKIYLLTPSGLYEPLGREGLYMQAVDLQLSLAPTEGQQVGRWFSDGRDPEGIPFYRYRWSEIEPSDELRAHEEYHRWVANGESKRPEQPTTEEVAFGHKF